MLSAPGMRVGALRNLGAATASSDVLAFIDADHEIAPGWVKAACEALSRPRAGAVGAPYTPPAGASWVQRMYDALRDHRPGTRRARWLGAGNVVVHGDAFSRIGGFDARLEACEDVDLCCRLAQVGYHVFQESRMQSIHHGDPVSLRALFTSELWRGRDNLRVTLRHMTLRDAPGLIILLADFAALVGGLVSLAFAKWLWSGAVLLGVLALSVPRAVRILRRLAHARAADIPGAFLVALTYDVARALALIARAPHRRAGSVQS